MDIAPEKIIVDFIAILPRYEGSVEKRNDAEVGTERKAGFRMQTNVHLAAKGEPEAQAAINSAFREGITDIIAFDYWSKDLDDVKVAARAQALKAAQSKAEVFLGAVFENRPPAINVQEQTVVRYPDSLDHSFTNTHDESVTPSFRRDIPFIRAPRPATRTTGAWWATVTSNLASCPCRRRSPWRPRSACTSSRRRPSLPRRKLLS